MIIAQGIGIVSFQLEAVVLLLTIDITRDAAIVEHRVQFGGQIESQARIRHRTVVNDLIACEIDLVVCGSIFEAEMTYLVAVAKVCVVRIGGKAGLQAIVRGISIIVKTQGKRRYGEGSDDL